MAKNSSLKQRIRSGETIVGKNVPLKATQSEIKEVLSDASYDYISVDSQHSAFNEERLVEVCVMAQEADVHVQFRIKHTRRAYEIGNYLDLGPSGIEVPQVELEATVDEAVDAFYYPQVGIRSWGGWARPGVNSMPDRVEYARWWNSYGLLWMQLESIQAVTNARKLAKPGVDCLSWGPADMSFNIEGHPEHPFRTIDDCLRHVLKQLEGSEARVVFRCSEDQRDKYAEMGVTVFLH